jgi:hypothetical protein
MFEVEFQHAFPSFHEWGEVCYEEYSADCEMIISEGIELNNFTATA